MTPPTESEASEAKTRRSGLPVGPLGLLAMTAIALIGAFGVAWVFVQANTQDTVDPTEILELDEGASTQEGVPGIGDPLPSVELEYLGSFEGSESGNLSDFAGTPMVINFWSSTCAPCLAEMPDLEQVSNEMADEVQFLGIDVTDTEEAGRKMIDRTGVTYPNARDPRAEIMGALGGIALPTTMLIDADGVLVDTHNGALTAEELTALIDDSGILSS